jgi:uncharacterized protein (TIGR00369 family)
MAAVEHAEHLDRTEHVNLFDGDVHHVRTHTVTWTDPSAVRREQNGRDGHERLLAMLRGESSPPPAVAALGIELEEVERGRVVFSLVADELHENPMGTMHGGVVATLVDTAMGCALVSTLGADEGFTTLELKTNFLRAITTETGRVSAVGTVVHAGSKIAMTEAHVYDANGVLRAHATSTCLIMRGQP